MTAGEGNGDRTTMAGQSGYDIWDRTTEIGKSVQVSLGRSARQGSLDR
jgi:hypothetical protein